MPILIRRLLHYLAYAVGGIVILLSAIALALRLAVMPAIDDYRPDIEALASKTVGVPVRIGHIEADWWHLNPRLALYGLELRPPGQASPLSLPRVNATFSWLSLLVWEPRLARLDLLDPELTARRDPTGVIYVAGIPVNQPGERSPFPDWLLRQHEVTVTDGRVTWEDERLSAPALILEQVHFRLDNQLGRHRFGLTAAPPPDSIRSIDIRGDLKGDSVHAWDKWRGRIYLNVQQASAEAMLRWAPWAQEQVRQGIGDARAWLDLAGGRLQGVSGDVNLNRVAVSLAEALPDMNFRSLSGHLAWRRDRNEHVLRVERLRFVSETGEVAEPALVDIRIKPTPAGQVETAQVAVKGLRLEALTALTHTLPLPARLQEWIARHNPRGQIETVEVAWLGSDRFRIKSRFREAGMNATEALPGFSGLDGEIEADEHAGRLHLASQGLYFAYDKVFRQPLSLKQLDARLSWVRAEGGGHRITLERGILSNVDLDGTVFGSLILPQEGPPVADIRAQLSRGEGNAVWKYLPRQVSDHAYDWVKQSIRGGTSPNTRLVLRGPLDQFPFAKGGGEFLVATKVDSATLQYAPDWPGIDGIDGWLIFKGLGMTVTTSAGQILGIPLGPVKAVIPDLHHSDTTHLEIEGTAAGPLAGFLEFIRQSPVFDYTERFTAAIKAEGQGALRLSLDLPLHHLDASRVAGELKLADARLDLGRSLPPLAEVNGSLSFSERSLGGSGIRVQLFGEPAALNLASERGGQVRARLEGRMPARALAEWLPAPLTQRLSGSAAYRAEVGLRQQQAEYRIESDLVGLGIRLPPPFGKPASLGRPLTLRAIPEETGRDGFLQAQVGDLLTVGITRPGAADSRIGILLGSGEPFLPDRPGIRVHGALQKLDLDAWQSTWAKDGAPEGGQMPPIHDINLSFNEIKVFDRRFNEINLHATPVPRGWRLRLAGQELRGEAIYDEPGGLPGKRLIGRFQKLQLPDEAGPGQASSGAAASPMELPRVIDISADSFSYAGRELGSLSTLMAAEGSGLRIRNLSLVAPEARLESNGWLSASSRRATDLEVKLETTDIGRLMRRLGHPEGIKGGAASISGNLNWMGRLEDFQLANLNGRLKAQFKNGRFTQMDPGVGRLLGIFSLQSLPRRIALDFRDVFSEGFAFDRIEGDIHIERGALYLPALQINGPSAKVRMNGKVDTLAETQNLRLLVEPRLDEGAALAGALLGGPVVGLGALVASKILQDPIAKAASFEYLVTGSWDEPTVTKLARQQPTVQTSPQ